MRNAVSRRNFMLGSMAGIGAASLLGKAEETPTAHPFTEPLHDFHVHRDNSTIDAILALSEERGVKFGIVEHAGTKENDYPVVLSNDAELHGYLDSLAGKPVFKGVQTEFTDWMTGFSPEALEKLDYILTDVMTWPDQDGKRQKMWEEGLYIGDPNTFMDRFVDYYVMTLETQPIDILANVSWLPKPFNKDYDTLWTEQRIARVIAAAEKHQVAIEISASFKLPKMPFLLQAKEAGLKFSFGSNGRYPKMGLLDHSVKTAMELGLTQDDLFMPAPDGEKAIQRRFTSVKA